MLITTILPFIVTCAIIEATPGPNMAYLAVLSISDGKRAGYYALLGVALGLFVIGMIAALGVASIIYESSLAYQVLRWCGILYLLWLSWDGWHAENNNVVIKNNDIYQSLNYFKKGLITNLLNPKAFVFYVAILPRFIDDSANPLRQSVALTLIYVLVATCIHVLIVELAGFVRLFLNNKQQTKVLRRLLSASLVLIAVWLAFTT
jgi:threonine/homoserine/homoserine lactone efflux protein